MLNIHLLTQFYEADTIIIFESKSTLAVLQNRNMIIEI